MSYLDIGSNNLTEDVINRKEFYVLKNRRRYIPDDNIIPLYMLEHELINGTHLFFHSYQTFVQNFININTPYTRLLLKHSTGSGKTLSAIGISLSFIENFKKDRILNVSPEKIGSIFIIAFEGAQRAFKKDLLRFPKLGFVTNKEISTWNSLNKKALSNNDVDLKNAASYGNKIRSRITNRKGNGYFKFIGYQALVNELFMSNDNILSELTESEILDEIKKGKININVPFLNTFKNSLIICDEIHNVYNSSNKNNWGIALQIILDNDKSTRAVFMSATPINNNPSEVVDLLNLLVEKKDRIERNTLFNGKDLKPESITLFRSLCNGRISYLIDKNPIQYPERIFMGEVINGIKHLKFVKCELTKHHLEAYKEAYNSKEQTISQSNRYVLDVIFPDPEHKDRYIYNSDDIKKIYMADKKWLTDNNISTTEDALSGEFLSLNNLNVISNKYFIMMNNIISNIKNKQGKIMIFHNYVEISGILFIKEILIRNGIIDENMTAGINTLCSICGQIYQEHDTKEKKNTNTHRFKPVRFVILHSELAYSARNRSIELFNHPSNDYGENFMIILGSKVLKESIDLKTVRHIMVMHRPDNIPTLIQILGRAVRKNSHISLPPEMRTVHVSIYIITRKDGIPTYDEIKYIDKMKDYNTIQKIEKILHEEAIDSVINRDIIIKSKDKNDEMGDLDYEIQSLKNNKTSFTLDELNLNTFNVYYSQTEIDLVTYIIKRAFIETSPVWTFNDLLIYIKSPNFNVDYDTKLISECSIIISLSQLLWTKNLTTINTTNTAGIIDKMLDITDKRIILGDGSIRVICQVGKYYMCLPLIKNRVATNTEILYRQYKDNTQTNNISITKYLQRTQSNNDSYHRKKNDFILKYINANIESMNDAVCDYGIDFHNIFIEECIVYVFNIRTNISSDFMTNNKKNHAFYFKMLYYYEIIGLVIYANTAKSYIYNTYTKYIEENDENNVIPDRDTRHVINGIKRRIATSSCIWCPRLNVNQYENKVIKDPIPATLNNKTKLNKTQASLLPIGHFLNKVPHFYHPDNGWYSSSEYMIDNFKWVENPIIIGFNEKSSKTGIRIRFKLRKPVQNIVIHKDSRLIEKGSACSSYPKEFLISLCTQLDIKIADTESISNICSEIYTRLLYLELVERTHGTNLKFFYSPFEVHSGKKIT